MSSLSKGALPQVDLYQMLEHRLTKPEFYMGKKDISVLASYIAGVQTIGWNSLGHGPKLMDLVSDPPFGEFTAWVREKYSWPGDSTDHWSVVLLAVERDTIGPPEGAEARAVDRFVEDLRLYREE